MPRLVSFFENLYYRPRWYHWAVAFVLLPIALLYASLMWFRRVISKPEEFGIPIISIGNLLVGGSGKTPMAIALASRFKKPAVVLRGYGRKSRGVQIVSEWGKISKGVEESGDEAMLLARSLKEGSVIVAEDRRMGIYEAKRLGAEVVILDDGFGKVDIKKFEILLYPSKVPNRLPLPSGPFREFPFARRYADLVMTEGREFRRIVSCEGCDEPMLLVTAIANPQRLEPYLPKELIKGRLILPDHAWFDKEEIVEAMREAGVTKILTTEKDAVKLEGFGLRTALLKLSLEIEPEALKAIERRVYDDERNKQV